MFEPARLSSPARHFWMRSDSSGLAKITNCDPVALVPNPLRVILRIASSMSAESSAVD